MGTQTTRLALPYPVTGDADNVPLWLGNLAIRLDSIAVPYSAGTFANRPAPGNQGFVYLDLTNSIVWMDNGTVWLGINQPPTIGGPPMASTPGDVGAIGTSGVAAESDHKHGRTDTYGGSGGLFGTSPNLARSDHTHTQTFTWSHTWAVSGGVAVPAGATGFIPPMFVSAPTGQTSQLVGVDVIARAGTATLGVNLNGTPVGGLAAVAASTARSYTTPTTPPTFADHDALVPVITAASGCDGLTITVHIQNQWTA